MGLLTEKDIDELSAVVEKVLEAPGSWAEKKTELDLDVPQNVIDGIKEIAEWFDD